MKLKEDFVAMMLYLVSALIIVVSVFFYFAGASETTGNLNVIYKVIFAFGIFPILMFCIIIIAIARIVDLLNQINQKLDK